MPVWAAAPPAASAIVPVYAVTVRSAVVPSFSATVYVNTSAVEPDPLVYAADALFPSVSVGEPVTTTASSQVTVIV